MQKYCEPCKTAQVFPVRPVAGDFPPQGFPIRVQAALAILANFSQVLPWEWSLCSKQKVGGQKIFPGFAHLAVVFARKRSYINVSARYPLQAQQVVVGLP
jgi:hypothetical protein